MESIIILNQKVKTSILLTSPSKSAFEYLPLILKKMRC